MGPVLISKAFTDLSITVRITIFINGLSKIKTWFQTWITPQELNNVDVFVEEMLSLARPAYLFHEYIYIIQLLWSNPGLESGFNFILAFFIIYRKYG